MGRGETFFVRTSATQTKLNKRVGVSYREAIDNRRILPITFLLIPIRSMVGCWTLQHTGQLHCCMLAKLSLVAAYEFREDVTFRSLVSTRREGSRRPVRGRVSTVGFRLRRSSRLQSPEPPALCGHALACRHLLRVLFPKVDREDLRRPCR